MKPYYEHAGITIYHGDCRDVLPLLTGAHLVVADPPYHGVVEEDWDHQWAGDDTQYLAWLDGVLALVEAAMTDNATLYLFSSPRLAAEVEMRVRGRFRVIASAVWVKGVNGGMRNCASGSGIDVAALRTYWPCNTERIVVAEKLVSGPGGADGAAADASGYWKQCEAAKRSVIGKYLKAEFARAGVTNKKISALFPSRTGNLTGCVSNWLLGYNLPTSEQYAAMREFLNKGAGSDEYLRRDYEDLRRDYEDLRRPFSLTAKDQWGDVWCFPFDRIRQHPTQKPIALLTQIVRVSSRPNNLVLDPFMGSGTTLLAAKNLNCRAVGIEMDERYCEIAAQRLSQDVFHFFPNAGGVE